MALRLVIKITATLIVLMPASERAGAQQSQDLQKAIAAPAGEHVRAGGISTDRLGGVQFRLWRSIREIVLAKDKSGRIKHPRLYGLWRDAEKSGHVIYIELCAVESLSRAGQFLIEEFDPKGLRHIAVVRLNLATIDRTYVGMSARRDGGWIPFWGLRANERYAEVLGHELAHAVRAFQDAEYMHLYQELEKEASQLNYGLHGLQNNAEVMARLDRIARLSKQIEGPAEAAEAEIWRELSAPGGADNSSPEHNIFMRHQVRPRLMRDYSENRMDRASPRAQSARDWRGTPRSFMRPQSIFMHLGALLGYEGLSFNDKQLLWSVPMQKRIGA
jgi:hypothetical protein